MFFRLTVGPLKNRFWRPPGPFGCHCAPFWPPFWLHFGSPGPQKKQLKVCNYRQKSHFGPFWTGTFFEARSWSSFFHVFFPFVGDFAAKMCQNGLPTWPPGGGSRSHFFSLFLSWGTLGTKMAPRPPPGAPRTTPSDDFR